MTAGAPFDALAVAGIGFVLGVRHATDADHVVAVTTIVAGAPSLGRAARVGAWWGVGHSLTLLLVGGGMVALRVTVPPRVGLALELLVAGMLVVLGALNVRASVGGAPAAGAPGVPGGARGAGPLDPRRPLLVGTVHGLAGSAAVALLVLATIRSTAWAVAYLAVFGLGTVAGMVLVTALVAAPAALAGPRVWRAERGIRLAAGTLSLVVGGLLAREIVVEGALFGARPSWTPH